MVQCTFITYKNAVRLSFSGERGGGMKGNENVWMDNKTGWMTAK